MSQRFGQYHTDAGDSELAGAVAIAPKLDNLKIRVLTLFREHHRLTDEELLARYIARWGEIYKNSLEPRRYELAKLGLVRKSDERRKGKSGVGRIVWAYVPREEQLALL